MEKWTDLESDGRTWDRWMESSTDGQNDSQKGNQVNWQILIELFRVHLQVCLTPGMSVRPFFYHTQRQIDIQTEWQIDDGTDRHTETRVNMG